MTKNLAPNTREHPTIRQHALLAFLAEFISVHGYGPSYREIMRGMNYRTLSVVQRHIENLVSQGNIVKIGRAARSINITTKGKKSLGTSTPQTEQKSLAVKTYEKWLVEQIDKKFALAEKTMEERDIDNLYVLIGSLQILGFDLASTAFKAKLMNFQNELDNLKSSGLKKR